jgi:hypothetical protein
VNSRKTRAPRVLKGQLVRGASQWVRTGGMTRNRTVALPTEGASPRRARAVVADLLSECGIEALVRTAQLLVSDVVTEAILLEAPDIELLVECDEHQVRIEVRNGLVAQFFESPSARYRRRALDTFADAWAAEPAEHGSVVWFEVRAA